MSAAAYALAPTVDADGPLKAAVGFIRRELPELVLAISPAHARPIREAAEELLSGADWRAPFLRIHAQAEALRDAYRWRLPGCVHTEPERRELAMLRCVENTALILGLDGVERSPRVRGVILSDVLATYRQLVGIEHDEEAWEHDPRAAAVEG